MAEAEFLFEFVPIVPPDPEMIGFEAILMANKFMELTPDEIGKITKHVRAGFEANFAAESSPEQGAWHKLADQTKRERLEEGYPYPEFPMLVRTGGYRASWIDREDPFHLEEYSYAGAGLTISEAVIEVGSRHPHVDPLETGTQVATVGMFADLDAGDAFLGFGGEGAVPSRPVRFLGDDSERAIGIQISIILNDAVEELMV